MKSKMKYKRMLCWVRPHEKKELIAVVNGQFPLVFANDYNEYKNEISENDYLVFSLSWAEKLNEIQTMVRVFPHLRFNLYTLGDELMESYHFKIMEEDNVTKGQYRAEHLVLNYTGEIGDLWEWNQNINKIDISTLENKDEIIY